MSDSCSDRRPARRRNGYVMVFGAFMISLVLIPAMGLAIDVGLMYTVESVMSAAADAAAVAGARDLARGTNDSFQRDNAKLTANNYFHANFPAGYLWSTNLQVNSDAPPSATSMRTVTTTASVDLPVIFLSMLHLAPQHLSTSSTATRRDVNVIFVMDRSASLNGPPDACGPLKSAAISFVNKFAETRDNVGLLTFGTTSLVNAQPSTTFKTNLNTILTNVVCVGGTGSAQALWQAYEQLITINQAGALNAILFFTDGLPTAVTENFPVINACGGGGTKLGVLTVGGASLYGLYNKDTQLPLDDKDRPPLPVGTNTAGCAFSAGGTTGGYYHTENNVGTDLQYAPLTDYWGNSLTATGYKTTTTKSLGLATTSTNIPNFSTNAADHAAMRIRRGDPDPLKANKSLAGVTIYTLGLGAVIDETLLKRIANDPSLANNPTAAGNQGKYYFAADASQLNQAFMQVASQMLRISQ